MYETIIGIWQESFYIQITCFSDGIIYISVLTDSYLITYDTRKTSEDDLQRVDFQQLFSTRCSKSVAKI